MLFCVFFYCLVLTCFYLWSLVTWAMYLSKKKKEKKRERNRACVTQITNCLSPSQKMTHVFRLAGSMWSMYLNVRIARTVHYTYSSKHNAHSVSTQVTNCQLCLSLTNIPTTGWVLDLALHKPFTIRSPADIFCCYRCPVLPLRIPVRYGTGIYRHKESVKPHCINYTDVKGRTKKK